MILSCNITSVMYKSRSPGFSTKLIHSGSGVNNDLKDVDSVRKLLCSKLAALDDAKYALVYPTGLASAAALFSLLKSGDHLLVASEIYSGTEEIIRYILTDFNIENTFLTSDDDLNLISNHIKPNTKMVFFETPSNPLLSITDMELLVKEVRKVSEDIIIANDNTFLTSYFQKPLYFGAEINLYSLSKYYNGHSDCLMGALVTKNKKYYTDLKKVQENTGNIPLPSTCKMMLECLNSLVVRMERIQQNSFNLARFLESHPRIEKVLHPSLPSHPQHKLALKQSYGFSGVFSFYIKNGNLLDSLRLLKTLKMVTSAASLGGPETIMQIPAVTTPVAGMEEDKLRSKVSVNMLRVSVGLEESDDLIDDFAQALERI